MGNVFFTTNSRKTICKLLKQLPNRLFPDNKVYLNRRLLEWKRESDLHDRFDDDIDSAFELSYETDVDDKSRRQTICGCRLTHKEEMKMLNEELATLRKQVEVLIAKETVGTKDAIAPPPPPPPLPSNLATSTPCRKEINVLKDITNVKLKPVVPKKMSPRKQDVRNDLHEILKRRYAAMHSPHSKRNLSYDDDENYLSCDPYATDNFFDIY